MTFLDQLTPDQKETILSLPYRVGLWVSHSDSGGGQEAEEQELRALASIIHAYAEEMFGSEAMQHVISGTLARKNDWPKWGAAENIRTVPQDCRIAVDVIEEFGGLRDANAFRNQLMEIGEAVALAFHENLHGNGAMGRFIAYISFLMTPNKTKRKKTFDEFLRISPNERRALEALEQSLVAK